MLTKPNGPGMPAHTEKYGVMSPFHAGGGGGGGGGGGPPTQAPVWVSSSDPGGQYGTHTPSEDGSWPTGHAAPLTAGVTTVTTAIGAALIVATKSIAAAARRGGPLMSAS